MVTRLLRKRCLYYKMFQPTSVVMVDEYDGSVRPDVVGNSQVFIRMELSGALPQLVFEVDQPAIEFLSEVRIYR